MSAVTAKIPIATAVTAIAAFGMVHVLRPEILIDPP
jgi:hypothetical protein